MKVALFPGSFDPVTKAHVDIIERSLPLFDKVVIGIGLNSTKTPFLSSGLREKILKAVFRNEPKIDITTYEGLTVEFCKKIGDALRGKTLSQEVKDKMKISAIKAQKGRTYSDAEKLKRMQKLPLK